MRAASVGPPASPLGIERSASSESTLGTTHWWEPLVASPMRDGTVHAAIDVAGLMRTAAAHSERILSVEQTQWIRGQDYIAAQAAFDPTVYANTRYDDTNDPVGDDLTTGGPNRLKENRWAMDAGLRGTTTSGATYRLGQQLGHLNSNTAFINPNDQGTARLGVTINQPLLRNRVLDQHRGLVLTTRLETSGARDQYLQTLQDQLLGIANTYWDLYQQRVTLIQRVEHLRRAEGIAQKLEKRQSFDAVKSQALRARATVAARRSGLAQSEMAVRNVESQLRSLVNAPELGSADHSELVPIQPAALAAVRFDMAAEVAAAFARRPELRLIRNRIQTSRVELDIARNRRLPQLNFIAEGYVAGLQGSSDIPGAWTDQFSRGSPGYAGGLDFEVPYRNRAASAQLRKQQVIIAQLGHVLRENQAKIQAEVEIAVRAVKASEQEIQSRSLALKAAVEELQYQQTRWEKLSGDPQFGQLQLDELFDTQDRVFQHEQALTQSLVNFSRGLITIQKATGALVQFAH